MPYIITTSRTTIGHDVVTGEKNPIIILSRRAVATLFEAREEAAYRIEQITGGDEDYEEIYADAQGCSELGNTFGPLPDNRTIEVKPVSMNWIIGVAEDHGAEFGEDESDANILEAFNADH